MTSENGRMDRIEEAILELRESNRLQAEMNRRQEEANLRHEQEHKELMEFLIKRDVEQGATGAVQDRDLTAQEEAQQAQAEAIEQVKEDRRKDAEAIARHEEFVEVAQTLLREILEIQREQALRQRDLSAVQVEQAQAFRRHEDEQHDQQQ